MQKNPYLECLLKDLYLSFLLIQFVGHLRPHRVHLSDELNKTFLRTGHIYRLIRSVKLTFDTGEQANSVLDCNEL
jgi:hypothetical protein